MTKDCYRCKEPKALSCFSKNNQTKDGLRIYCRDCIHEENKITKTARAIWDKKYRQNNLEKVTQARADYYQKNKSRIKVGRAIYITNNKEKINQYNKSPRAIALASAKSRRRHAAKLQRAPIWADQQAITAIYDEAQKQGEFFEVEVDHIIPLQGKLVSGLHVAENLQIIFAYDNRVKYNTFNPQEFNNA